MIKLMAIDIDGTLLDDRQNIPEENVKAIEKLMSGGVYIALCSGRAIHSILSIAQQLKLNQYDKSYIVALNGTCIFKTGSDEVLISWVLTKNAQQAIHQLSIDYAIPVIFNTRSCRIMSHHFVDHEFVSEKICNINDIKYLSVENITRLDSVLKASFVAPPEQLEYYLTLPDFRQALGQYHSVRSEPWMLEISAAHSGKGAALDYLSRYLKLARSDLACIGNQENDISMFAAAAWSFAVGNAPDNVKQYARYITATNNQAGVAQAVRRLTGIGLLST